MVTLLKITWPKLTGSPMDIVAGLAFVILLAADVWRLWVQERSHMSTVPTHSPSRRRGGGGLVASQRAQVWNGVTDRRDGALAKWRNYRVERTCLSTLPVEPSQ